MFKTKPNTRYFLSVSGGRRKPKKRKKKYKTKANTRYCLSVSGRRRKYKTKPNTRNCLIVSGRRREPDNVSLGRGFIRLTV